DEHDLVTTSVQRDGRGWRVSGLLRPDELLRATGLGLPEDSGKYETIAGLVLRQLGRIPVPGDVTNIGGVEVTVERMDGRRIDLVRLTPLDPEDDARAAEDLA